MRPSRSKPGCEAMRAPWRKRQTILKAVRGIHRACSLWHAYATPRHNPQDHGQRREHGNEIRGDRVAALAGRIVSKEARAGSNRHECKNDVPQGIAQGCAYPHERNALELIQRTDSIVAVEDPEWNQIQRIEPRAGAGQRAPQSIMCLK